MTGSIQTHYHLTVAAIQGDTLPPPPSYNTQGDMTSKQDTYATGSHVNDSKTNSNPSHSYYTQGDMTGEQETCATGSYVNDSKSNSNLAQCQGLLN